MTIIIIHSATPIFADSSAVIRPSKTAGTSKEGKCSALVLSVKGAQAIVHLLI